MMHRLANFAAHEDGAVTVDWVVLTAGLVGFGSIIFLNLSDPIQHVDSETGTALSSMEVHQPEFNISY
ncbi:hypothetical protein J7406_04350 [Ruegeria sp. R8_2]|nr:hypothetical protein [Ruegeria sp. R8_1]MBO9414731.1 hypothetical protein [Ruegeria sp. R8_2]